MSDYLTITLEDGRIWSVRKKDKSLLVKFLDVLEQRKDK